MNFIYLDFEFVNPQEPNPTLICCALSENGGEIERYWLHDGSDTAALYSRLSAFKGYLVAYNVSAEARCLIALDLDPMSYKWIDPMVEWKALQNHNDEFKYGCYFDKWGNKKFSDPGTRNSKMERVNQQDETVIGTGLADCVAHLLEVNLDKIYKSGTIDLILTRGRGKVYDGKVFSDVEQHQILEYCASDIQYLKQLLERILYHETRLWGLDLDKELLPAIVERARFNVCMSILEKEGFPIDMKILDNLTNNYKSIADDCYRNMNEIFPIFEQVVKCSFRKEFKKQATEYIQANIPEWPRTKTGKLELRATTIASYRDRFPSHWLTPLFRSPWKKKQSNIVKLIESKEPHWPKAAKGGYKTDKKTLKEFSYIPEINALRKNSKTLRQINWFRPAVIPELHEKIGLDGRLRPYFNPFGAQSGRSQPPAKSYPFLWSSWLRCTVRAKPGKVMVSADYGSQEFIVAAALSGDQNMIKAYDSKDPYLYFAKLAGAVPWEGTRDEYPAERDMFKEVVLGLQYGLGVKKLAAQLSYKLGQPVTMEETKELINKHKNAFPVFWAWADDINHHYFTARKPIIMGYNMSDLYESGFKGDLWPMGIDNPNSLSVKNVPVQGVSASIMRRAVIKFVERDIPVFATLHDGFYFHVDSEKAEQYQEAIAQCMNEAAIELIGRDIRIDFDIYTSADLYVPPKGKQEFERFKKYIIGE